MSDTGKQEKMEACAKEENKSHSETERAERWKIKKREKKNILKKDNKSKEVDNLQGSDSSSYEKDKRVHEAFWDALVAKIDLEKIMQQKTGSERREREREREREKGRGRKGGREKANSKKTRKER